MFQDSLLAYQQYKELYWQKRSQFSSIHHVYAKLYRVSSLGKIGKNSENHGKTANTFYNPMRESLREEVCVGGVSGQLLCRRGSALFWRMNRTWYTGMVYVLIVWCVVPSLALWGRSKLWCLFSTFQSSRKCLCATVRLGTEPSSWNFLV